MVTEKQPVEQEQPEPVEGPSSSDSGSLQTPSPVPTPPPVTPSISTPSSLKGKKKKRSIEDPFQHELLKRLDGMEEEEDDEFDAFGEEVARGLRVLGTEMQQHLVMRDIRDILFKARFPPRAEPQPFTIPTYTML